MCDEEEMKCLERESAPPRSSILEKPNFMKKYGWKHVKIISMFGGSMACWSVVMALGTAYFCDWKLILQYIPYYNGKFKEEPKK